MEKENKNKEKQIAKNMLNKGIDIKIVEECTGFSIKELNDLN